MKKVEIIFEGEALTVQKLKEILEELPEEMVIADFYNDMLTEVTRVSILRQTIEDEEHLIIG